MAKRGGKRAGAGRKPNPLRDMRIGAASAERILNELKHEKELVDLYSKCGDARLKVHIIFGLRAWAYGKPVQMQEDKLGFDPTAPLRVIVEHIGGKRSGATNPLPAKTK